LAQGILDAVLDGDLITGAIAFARNAVGKPLKLVRDREDKIAAIGVRIKRWVTLHGVALNIDCDLSHYAGIVPCGVSDPRYGITSLADLGHAVTLPEIDAALRREFEHLFGPVARGQVAADSLVPSFPAT